VGIIEQNPLDLHSKQSLRAAFRKQFMHARANMYPVHKLMLYSTREHKSQIRYATFLDLWILVHVCSTQLKRSKLILILSLIKNESGFLKPFKTISKQSSHNKMLPQCSNHSNVTTINAETHHFDLSRKAIVSFIMKHSSFKSL